MDLFSAALSLVIHKQGSVTESDVDDLLERYRTKQKIIVDQEIFRQELSNALQHYQDRTRCLFVCTEISCRNKTFLDLDDEKLQLLSINLGCDVEATGCHWVCESAPVLTFKLGSELTTFSNCASQGALRSVAETIKQLVS